MNPVHTLFGLLFISASLLPRGISAQDKPKLILQITIDQLRGDMPGKYTDRYGEGGFKYLLNQGIHYVNAHYAHSNTETGVGHTALATGAHPSLSGIIGNEWFDVNKGKSVYCVDDERYPVLTFTDSIGDQHRHVGDPLSGKSPSNILCSTFSDELTLFSDGKSKIFGISFKDRGAITLAGHTGKAFWFDSRSGNFITSAYYYKEYPVWVSAWNKKRFADTYLGKKWELMQDKNSYLYQNRDDQPFEVNRTGYGRVFPHPYGTIIGPSYYSNLMCSPAGDEILLDFTKSLIENENIGKDTITDFLAVSFSCTDYVGHTFGPSSLEAEDNLLRLDRTLAGLFQFVDRKVGLKNTLIVFSADHGVGEAPGLAAGYGLPAGHAVIRDFMGIIYEKLKERFGSGMDLIRSFQAPNIYLDHVMIEKKKLAAREVSEFLADQLMNQEGIEMAVITSSLNDGGIVNKKIAVLIENNYYPGLSGDIYVVPKPYWTIVWDKQSISYMAAGHGTPWSYDTYVPIIFAGFGIKGEIVPREVHTVDIAGTLSVIAGTKYPSGNCGEVLGEVIDSVR